MMDAITLTEQTTLARFNAGQDRVARDFGYGQTVGALKITQSSIELLSSLIRNKIDNLSQLSEADPEKTFLRVIRNLSPETIGYSTLNSALSAVAMGQNSLQARLALGQGIAGECFAAGLLEHDAKLARRIDSAVRKKHGNLKYRKQAARSIAKKAGFQSRTWARSEILRAGNVLYAYLLEALPHVFEHEDVPGTQGFLTVTPGALALAEDAVELTLREKPVFFPTTEPPKPWTGWFDGGYWDERTRMRTAVVRTHHKQTAGAIRAAIRDGSMQPHLDALNTLQAVPWTINTRILEVLKHVYEAGIPVAGLPPKDDVAVPEKPAPWEDMDADGRRLWKHRKEKVKERNRSYMANRVLLKTDTETADQLATADRFWTPMNCDWRGRVYGVPHFNFQRDDRVRALFLFADGMPLGEEGLWYLKVHTANCGDFDKISKQPLEDRVAWVDKNLHRLQSAAAAPLSPNALSFWTKADKPFLFLAALMELAGATTSPTPTAFTTHLPVSFDGSCSGLQHLAAMTRDAATGRLVNLTANKRPEDVYQTAADIVIAEAKRDAAHGNVSAKAWLAYGIERKVVKRNVMTYSYSSKKFGMAQQHVEDLMKPLAFDVIAGKVKVHPFATDDDTVYDKDGEAHKRADGTAAAQYLASHVYEAIETVAKLPAEAMAMLQKCARALAHEGKPMTWTTPLGLPWINRYHAPTVKRLNLWLHDKSIRMVYADGYKTEIDKDKAANGVAPNFVHALDATHLLMVASASARENITQLATVHDSFGCLAPQAARFNAIIREQLIELYETHDVLNEALEQAKHDLTVHNLQRLPVLPDYGDLNLEEIRNATYAFA